MEHLLCPISEKARTSPDHPALITDTATWTWSDLDRSLHSLTHLLHQETRVRPGQRIAFVARHDPSTLLLFFALFRLGAIACPLSYRLPQEQLCKSLEQLKPAHIVEPHLLPLEQSGDENFPILSILPSCYSHSENNRMAGWTGWEKGLKINMNSLATFLFTSGSTATPKIACHSIANHYYSALGALDSLRLTSASRWLLSLPLFHVSGIGVLFRCFMAGASVVLSHKTVPQALEEFLISHLSLVPTQLYRMLQDSTVHFPSSLRCLLLGGAPIPAVLLQRAKEKQLPVFTTYGLTETSSLVALSEENPSIPSGKTLPFREIRMDENQEIWVSGKILFQGYWDAQSETILKADHKGWFPTKDIGSWLPSGDLVIQGRKDRMFISGGENIHPEEIESALLRVPGILQASVVPIDDPEFGQRPAAFIDDATGAHTLQSVREALSRELPSFKHPVQLLPYPEDQGLKPDLSALKLRTIAPLHSALNTYAPH